MKPFTPRSYQLQAINLMCSKPGAGLFLDPGMGKTSSTLATATILQKHGEMRAMLVIAPIRPARNVWPAEIQKWTDFAHLRVSLVLGTEKQRLAALAADADIYVINPENVDWLADQVILKRTPIKPDVLVVDESTKFKSGKSKRFKALKALLQFFRRRYILTGTPAPQSLEDLWSQTAILDGGSRLGRSLTQFREQYFNEYPQRGGYSLWEPKEGADTAIFTRIADVALRLSAKDHLDMPELIENKIVVTLPTGAMKAYRELERSLVTQVKGGTITAANAAAASMKLRQTVNGAVYDEDHIVHPVHEVKLEALRDLIEEQSGQPLLVAVAFQHDADRIREFLHDKTIPYLGGGMSSNYADAVIEAWNAGELPVVLAHPASVAHGLNLQSGGNSICWFSLTWSLEDFIQFNARVWRQGQASRTVVIHYILAQDTIDEYVLESLTRKDARQISLFNILTAYAKERA
jgi:SNF2 family DNA or RNA helicase